MLLAGGTLEGRVSRDGVPVVAETVAAHDGRGHVVSTQSGEDGWYRFENLPPGRYVALPLGSSVGLPKVRRMGVESAGGLPPPDVFFEFPVEILEHRTARFDLDPDVHGLGTIECEIRGDVKPDSFVEAGFLYSGMARRVGPLGQRVPVRSATVLLGPFLPGAYGVRWSTLRELLDEVTIEVLPNRVSSVTLAARSNRED